MKNTSISLGDYFDQFVSSQVSVGRYKNVSEVIRAGLRLLEDEDSKVIALRKAIQEGIDSGIAHNFNSDKHLQELKAKNVQIYALETAQEAKSLHSFNFENKATAFVVGNERFGLEASTLALCDGVIAIPTFGIKNSLNVANALSIAAYEWRRQWK